MDFESILSGKVYRFTFRNTVNDFYAKVLKKDEIFGEKILEIMFSHDRQGAFQLIKKDDIREINYESYKEKIWDITEIEKLLYL